MRERTTEDDRIARKKHFEKGDLVEIRLLASDKSKIYVILEKTHLFHGKNGTHYKVWDIGEGIELKERYLHDIPEDKAEVKLLESSNESTTAKSNG